MTRYCKVALFFIVLITFQTVFSQGKLNPYKYIVVPKQYDFLKEENQHRLNSFTKYLFVNEGFEVFYQGDEYPADLMNNPCLSLTADVLDDSGAFTTKLYLVLNNCYGQEVFKSVEGKSKLKDYTKTYVDALKKCFVSVQDEDYQYDAALTINASSVPVVQTTAAPSAPSAEVPPPNTTDVDAKAGLVAVSAAPVVEPEKMEVDQTDAEEAQDALSVHQNSADDAFAEEVSVGEVAVMPPVVEETSVTEVAVMAPVVEEAAAEEPEITVAEEQTEKQTVPAAARAFKNDQIAFLLIDQGNQMQAFVSESKNEYYKPGELIGTFIKTSLPNVFRVAWKSPQKGVGDTTAYFDEKGNLRVDIMVDDQIEVRTFIEVK